MPSHLYHKHDKITLVEYVEKYEDYGKGEDGFADANF